MNKNDEMIEDFYFYEANHGEIRVN